MTTLQKILYENLEQFVEDINKNFAIVQNSPLYKGIQGKKGIDGEIGPRGIRGTKFLFVNFSNFHTEFPTLISSKEINKAFINSQLTFENRDKLLTALNITELVDKDMVVLTDTKILQYDDTQTKFIDTNIAFNEQTNLISNIQTQISTLIQEYVDSMYSSLEKPSFRSYQTNQVTHFDQIGGGIGSSKNVLLPLFPGDNINTIYREHNYFGFDNIDNGNKKSTLVVGNINKFKDQLINTGLDFNTEYSINSENTPALVVLQDNIKNGLMIGRQLDDNTQNFGSFYKGGNDTDGDSPLIIKSHMGDISNDAALMKFYRDKFVYNKNAHIVGDLTIDGITNLNGNIVNASINVDPNKIELGDTLETSRIINRSKNIFFKNFLNNILVTDDEGKLRDDIILETNNLTNNTYWDSESPTNKKLVNSSHIKWLRTKLLDTETNLGDNYYTKEDFIPDGNGNIPTLKLSTGLMIKTKVVLTSTQDFYANTYSIGFDFDAKTVIDNNYDILNIRNISHSGSFTKSCGNNNTNGKVVIDAGIDGRPYLKVFYSNAIEAASLYGYSVKTDEEVPSNTDPNRFQFELKRGGINIPADANYLKNGNILGFDDLSGFISGLDYDRTRNFAHAYKNISDLNNAKRAGLYNFHSDASNRPGDFPNTNLGFLLVNSHGYTNQSEPNMGGLIISQLALIYDADNNQRLFTRYKKPIDTIFGNWKELLYDYQLTYNKLRQIVFGNDQHSFASKLDVIPATKLWDGVNLEDVLNLISINHNDLNISRDGEYLFTGVEGSTEKKHPTNHPYRFQLKLSYFGTSGSGSSIFYEYIGIYVIMDNSGTAVRSWQARFYASAALNAGIPTTKGMGDWQSLDPNDIINLFIGSFVSAAEAPSANSNTGKIYYNSTLGQSYISDGSIWELLAAKGETGAKGDDGATWYSKDENPLESLGVIGDFYLNTATWDISEKIGSLEWEKIGNIQGAKGAKGETGATGATGAKGDDGATWYSGFSDPSPELGEVGDFYLITSTWWIRKKTGNLEWTPVGNIQGAQGAQGDKGDKGDTGVTGKNSVLTCTSTKSITLGSHILNLQTFNYVIDDNSILGLGVGAKVKISSTTSPTSNFMVGTVTELTSTEITVNIDSHTGSGTHSEWTIVLSTGVVNVYFGTTTPSVMKAGDIFIKTS